MQVLSLTFPGVLHCRHISPANPRNVSGWAQEGACIGLAYYFQTPCNEVIYVKQPLSTTAAGTVEALSTW